MTKWLKDNVMGIIGIVFIAGGLYVTLNNHDKRLSNHDELFSKQDDYNSNTDQKIDDAKSSLDYIKGYMNGVKDEQEKILFEMTLIDGIKNKH